MNLGLCFLIPKEIKKLRKKLRNNTFENIMNSNLTLFGVADLIYEQTLQLFQVDKVQGLSHI